VSLGRVGFLGPEGTFSHEALGVIPEAWGAEAVPYPSVFDVVRAVEEGEVAAGVVPIENSLEGSVNATLDALAFEANVLILREVDLPIHHHLLAPQGVGLEEIRVLFSHPHASAQCRGFLARKLAGVELRATNSTAEAARAAAAVGAGAAAIGSATAARIFGLEILVPGIMDRPDNRTRFVLLGRYIPPPTGADKTSVVCFIAEDRPGSLLGILEEFAIRQINLTKIESRPTKERLGEYCFFVDLEGHIAEPRVAEALKGLHRRLAALRFLGSYPRALGSKVTPVPEESQAAAYRKAEEWLQGYLAMVAWGSPGAGQGSGA
jgi:prephenate dehydratase